jgi:hypothetical protein
MRNMIKHHCLHNDLNPFILAKNMDCTAWTLKVLIEQELPKARQITTNKLLPQDVWWIVVNKCDCTQIK